MVFIELSFLNLTLKVILVKFHDNIILDCLCTLIG